MASSPFPLPAKQDIVNAAALERDFRELHRLGPVARAEFPFGGEGWIITSYDEVRSVLADPRFSLEALLTAGDYPRIRQVETGPPAPPAFNWYDPPVHTRKRAVLMKHLSVKRVRALRPRTAEMVEQQLDRFVSLGPPADLMEDFARRIPVRVISDLLGALEDEHYRFLDAAHLLGNSRAETPEQAAEALETLKDYFGELVERKRAHPGDDLISALLRDVETAGVWTEEELHGVGVVLLLAGHDATTAILGGILEWLAHEPELYQQLRNVPETFPAAFEELVRLLPAGLAGTRSRMATEDVVLGDVVINKGEFVLPIVHAANLDEEAYEHADQLVFDRPERKPHVAFGYGPHACVGLQLARMEIDVAVRAVLARFTHLTVVDENPDWKERRLLRGPKSLRVAWS